MMIMLKSRDILKYMTIVRSIEYLNGITKRLANQSIKKKKKMKLKINFIQFNESGIKNEIYRIRRH